MEREIGACPALEVEGGQYMGGKLGTYDQSYCRIKTDQILKTLMQVIPVFFLVKCWLGAGLYGQPHAMRYTVCW